MYSPKIRKDLIPRLYKISRAKGLAMTQLVNRYLDACVNCEEQLMARGHTVVEALEAVLAQIVPKGE